MVIYFIICDVLSSHQLFVIFRSQNSQHNIIIPLKSPSKRSSGHCLVKETIKLASNQNFYSMTKTFTNTTNGFRSDDKSNRCILPIAVCLFVFCMALFFSCICVWWTYFGCLNLTLFVSMAIACWTKENKSSKKKKRTNKSHIQTHRDTHMRITFHTSWCSVVGKRRAPLGSVFWQVSYVGGSGLFVGFTFVDIVLVSFFFPYRLFAVVLIARSSQKQHAFYFSTQKPYKNYGFYLDIFKK